MTQVTEFKLNDTVHQVIADGVGPSPFDVAAKVLELIPIGSERDVLSLLLPEYCRHLIRLPTHNRMKRLARSATGRERSKWSAVREEILKEAWAVDGQWYEFGDLTPKAVTWLITDRKQGAEELSLEANRLTNLLSVMKRQKASTVRELPFDLIEKVMS